MKLNVKAFGLACGLFWGFGLMLVTWWVILIEGSTGDLLAIGHVYRGYCVSLTGSFIGLAWGLVDGFIGGVILAWLYNLFAGYFSGKKSVPIAEQSTE